jgi:hypothetical protein
MEGNAGCSSNELSFLLTYVPGITKGIDILGNAVRIMLDEETFNMPVLCGMCCGEGAGFFAENQENGWR